MRPETRLIVLGTRGQLAFALRRALSTLGEVVAIGRETTPVAIDLARPAGLIDALVALRPSVIVNAAAYTAVDAAEADPEAAAAVNAIAPGLVAEAARRADALLVHVSTDYVFDGAGTRPYRETDAVAPLGVYGRTKAAGEAAVAASGAAHLILRTAWLYDARGHNFFRTIRRLARERAVLRVVDDQRGAPTWAVQVALAVSQMLAVVGTDPGTRRAVTGTYHLAAAGEATWYDFATAIVEALRLRETVAVERVEAIPTTAWPTPARRPAYSVLDCEAAAKAFGVRLPDWREGLALLQATLDETGDLP